MKILISVLAFGFSIACMAQVTDLTDRSSCYEKPSKHLDLYKSWMTTTLENGIYTRTVLTFTSYPETLQTTVTCFDKKGGVTVVAKSSYWHDQKRIQINLDVTN